MSITKGDPPVFFHTSLSIPPGPPYGKTIIVYGSTGRATPRYTVLQEKQDEQGTIQPERSSPLGFRLT
ncbi:MAG: hypothetical protein CSA26_06665 [Desulfobacterales bacterium]|nr:MAG: hypothetical protein CSA26_06665 [Desulfobacterales bacterium]